MPFSQPPPALTWNNLDDAWADLHNTWLGVFDPYVQLILGEVVGFEFVWASLENQWADLSPTWSGIFEQALLNPPPQTSSTDITSSAFGMSTSRGRNRDLQRTNAGAIGAQLRNETRLFDPQSESPIRSFVRPRIPVTLKVDGFNALTGVVNDWDFTYDVSGQSVASITGADAFTFFAQESASGSAIAESPGARLNRVLDDLPRPFPADRRLIDEGNATFAAQEYDENALGYLQQIEESEGGLIFMTRENEIAFKQRLSQPEEDVLQFSDEGSGIPYESIEITFGTDLLANRVIVQSSEGTAIVTNQDSVDLNGVAELSINSLLTFGALDGLAQFLLFRFGTPEYRIAGVTVNLKSLPLEQRANVLRFELGDQADVIFTPNGVGDPISIRNRIIGISHDVSLDNHLMTFNFEALGFAFFILDDEDAGRLNNTDFVLGF
jgi:hypothetical protein